MSVPTLSRDTAFQVRSLFSNYNFREYARRRTIDAFREHQHETEDRKVQEFMQDGLQNLRMMKRQTIISQFFQLDKLVVEGQKTGKETGEEGGIVRQKDTGSSRSGRQFGDGANRTRTGQIDHDVFEGLPVRRWTRQTQTVSQVPKSEASESIVEGPGGKQKIPEHPMPRDSHLLTPQSRALLRAARAGCIYIRQASKESEDDEKEATDVEEQPVLQSSERTFVTRKWATVPRHLEAPEVEFLAKRRPGLASLYGASAGSTDGGNNSAPMRRTRFKKVDSATGNISIYEAWVPEGHKIEGEITDDARVVPESSAVTVTPEAPAPGTVIDGVGVVNAEGVVVAEAGSVSVMTPPKRRPPPPKRKAKGFGKGRRKKVMFAPGDGADASLVHESTPGGTDGGTEDAHPKNPSQMSAEQTGNDDEEDDDEEGEESDEGDESMLDVKTPETPGHQPTANPSTDAVSEMAAEQVSASTEIADSLTEVKPSEAPSEPPPAVSVSPTAPEPTQPKAEDSVAAPPPEETQNGTASEDVEMTEAKPDAIMAEDLMDSIAHPASDVAQPATGPDVPAPTQVAALASEPSPVLEGSREQSNPEVPLITSLEAATTESTEPVVSLSAPHEDTTMELSPDLPQTFDDKAPEKVSIPEQVNFEPTETHDESNDVDMLDTLEASLDQPVVDTQVGHQAAKQAESHVEEPPEQVTAGSTVDQAIEKPPLDALEPKSDNPAQPSSIQPGEQPIENAEQQSDPAKKDVPVTVEDNASESPSKEPIQPPPEEPSQQAANQTIEPVVEPADPAAEHSQETPEKLPTEKITAQESTIVPEPPLEQSAEPFMEPPIEQSSEPASEQPVEAPVEAPAEAPAESPTKLTEDETSVQEKDQTLQSDKPSPQQGEIQPPKSASPVTPTSLPEDGQPKTAESAALNESTTADVAPITEPIPELQRNEPSEPQAGDTEGPTEPLAPEPSDT
ncbi:hypothetical protein FE257_008675 [Aspergillus nanangensis]|uniref:Complex 1 LYR protein domain-containing protein n=1 Tax=Aspergillus nanangensis TaxID=2582783 RepID=A0AAD4CL94_ASPNN|nr:hypothetical protein FE257_008675 [Aspergillus nanangensis]